MGPTCSEINDHLFFQLKLAKPLIKVYALISVRVSADVKSSWELPQRSVSVEKKATDLSKASVYFGLS